MTDTPISQSERQRTLLEWVAKAGEVSVQALAAHFAVTPETIRRDISQLHKAKLIKKVHGGAVAFALDAGLVLQLKFEREFHERTELAKAAKEAIAKAAVRHISEGDTLFVDFGSTTLAFARELVQVRHLTVISNSPLIADILQANDTIEVILLGGQFIASKFECLGSMTLSNIAQFFADYAVIGAGAIHKEIGFMDQDVNEAAVARKMIEHAKQRMVLADASKAGRHALSFVAPWSEVDFLITNEASLHFVEEARTQICIASQSR